MEKVFLYIMIAAFLWGDSVFAAGCAEVGRKIAAQQRGVLVRSTPVFQDGREKCIVMIIVPTHDGKKLRRLEISVPAD